ncbi:3-hydroxyacyl-CoA dehydrogenase family protein [Actinomadura sp. 9N407]|uniref:3-hydroxyacyl-CoA dehydrogenase family protein n=1 Tax=Actinomadura sp. 9N407 TaxID=3375154 RepID=UPI003792C4E7
MTRFGIVGGGLMGHGIAVALAKAGHSAAVYDVDPQTMATFHHRVGPALAQCGVPGSQAGPIGARITTVQALHDIVRDVDVLVEAVPERLEDKHQVMATLEAVAAPETPIWTNTSVLSITQVAEGMAHPERLAGVHWWNPPYLVPLVEVAPGARTDPRVLDEACDLLSAMGKTTVRLRRDVPGFVGNRLQFALVREALSLLDQGVCDPATIDTVMRSSLGLRWSAVGPMENADYIGLALTRDILGNLAPHLSTEKEVFPGLDKPLSEDRHGRASGAGLLPWPSGRETEVAERLGAGIRRNLADLRTVPNREW